MSKYDALGRYLRNQEADHVPMTFREIERLTGAKLPASKRYPAWWSNNAWNNVMTKVWLEAGFKSEQVDIPGERLVFRRDSAKPRVASNARPAGGSGQSIIGALRDTFTIEPDWDLSKSPLDAEERQGLDQATDRSADLVDSGLRRGRH